ncbi:MAG: TA system VapC family ribonuclease toxin [Candidatus Sulfotelmatobacter sp.]
MPTYLLDANVLIALAWPEHSAHERASLWFGRHARQGWATCPMTQAALVRILSNPAFSPRSLTPSGALLVLKRNVELPGHQFWNDSLQLNEALERIPTPLTGHRQITDVYLVALAIHNRGRLATLDHKIAHIAPAGSLELIS